jgi:hypothetical protein
MPHCNLYCNAIVPGRRQSERNLCSLHLFYNVEHLDTGRFRCVPKSCGTVLVWKMSCYCVLDEAGRIAQVAKKCGNTDCSGNAQLAPSVTNRSSRVLMEGWRQWHLGGRKSMLSENRRNPS